MSKLREYLINKIDGKMNIIRTETSSLMESLIEIRAAIDEISYLKILEKTLDTDKSE